MIAACKEANAHDFIDQSMLTSLLAYQHFRGADFLSCFCAKSGWFSIQFDDFEAWKNVPTLSYIPLAFYVACSCK